MKTLLVIVADVLIAVGATGIGKALDAPHPLDWIVPSLGAIAAAAGLVYVTEHKR